MHRYIVHRLVSMIPTLVGISIVVFLVINMTPGDPARLMLGDDATPETLERLRRELGLDDPLPIRYVRWLSDVLQGNLGRSLWLQRPVLGEVIARLGATALLAGMALALATVLGVTLGVISAVRRHSWIDRLSMVAALIGVSMPTFWLGILLILIFSLALRLFPPAGMVSPGGGDVLDILRHLTLPAIALSGPTTAILARLTRASMLEVVNQDYIRTASAKGLKERAVVLRHALKNALIPVTAVLGVQVGTLLGGAVVTETVFAWPGIGTLIVQGVLTRDFLLVQGAVLILAINFSLVNLITDLLLGYVDPRIRYS